MDACSGANRFPEIAGNVYLFHIAYTRFPIGLIAETGQTIFRFPAAKEW